MVPAMSNSHVYSSVPSPGVNGISEVNSFPDAVSTSSGVLAEQVALLGMSAASTPSGPSSPLGVPEGEVAGGDMWLASAEQVTHPTAAAALLVAQSCSGTAPSTVRAEVAGQMHGLPSQVAA